MRSLSIFSVLCLSLFVAFPVQSQEATRFEDLNQLLKAIQSERLRETEADGTCDRREAPLKYLLSTPRLGSPRELERNRRMGGVSCRVPAT